MSKTKMTSPLVSKFDVHTLHGSIFVDDNNSVLYFRSTLTPRPEIFRNSGGNILTDDVGIINFWKWIPYERKHKRAWAKKAFPRQFTSFIRS